MTVTSSRYPGVEERMVAPRYNYGLRRHPVKVRHPYWTSQVSPFALIHVARPDGYMYYDQSTRGFYYGGRLFLDFLCPAVIAHPTPVGPKEEGRRVCWKCIDMAKIQNIGLLGTR